MEQMADHIKHFRKSVAARWFLCWTQIRILLFSESGASNSTGNQSKHRRLKEKLWKRFIWILKPIKLSPKPKIWDTPKKS